jgi:uncharacterized protein YabE (DUF348 family)/3D (Asp-Asp-Asp) domain-containing protein
MMITQLKGSKGAFRLPASKLVALIIAVAILCAGTAFAASPNGMYNVDVYDGSEITRVSTYRTDAEAVLKQADIEIAENDKLVLNDFVPGEDSTITIYRAAGIEYIDLNGNAESLIYAGTVSDFLAERGITLNEEILSSLPEKTVLKDGMTLKLQNAQHVTVVADGNSIPLVMGAGTVAEALAQAGVSLDENDETVPSADTELYDGIEISVLRVEYQTRTEQKTVAFSKKTEKTNELYKGTSELAQKGENGLKEVTYQDKIVNGSLDSSTVTAETVLKEAVDQITKVGTKAKPVTVAALKNGGAAISELSVPAGLEIENGVPKNYKSIVTGKAAAYTESKSAKTASGRPVQPGYIAVNPNQFPYGTELWIVSTDGIVYGYCIAADTGGFINKGKFTVDLFMNTESECKQWGSRDVIIYVL